MHKAKVCGNNNRGRKSGKFVKGGRIFLCKSGKVWIGTAGLWISAVEKPVEIVENYWFSTGISGGCSRGAGCGKVCIPVCIIPEKRNRTGSYVTAERKVFPIRKKRKCSDIGKNPRQKTPGREMACKNL